MRGIVSHGEGNYEPQGESGFGSTGRRILYMMVQTLSVGLLEMWQSSIKPLFLMLAISLFIDERLTFSFLAIDAISGLTSMVLRSILLSRSRSICSARSNGRLGGLPLGRPVARCFMLYSLSPRRA